MNGVAVTAAKTDVAPITTGPLSIDANGVLTVAANTPSGTNTIIYDVFHQFIKASLVGVARYAAKQTH